MEIADCLRGKNMITLEMYNKIQAGSTTQDQMRELQKHLNSNKVRSEFYQILKKKQPYLIEDLESGVQA